MTIISVNPATCISGGHGVGLKSLHPPPPKPNSQGASPAVVWVVWPGNEGMIPRGTAGMHGGEARRKGKQGGHPLCRGSIWGAGRPCRLLLWRLLRTGKQIV